MTKVREIPLTQGEIALVDDSDYELIIQFKWRRVKRPHTQYAITTKRGKSKKTIMMHRLILNPSQGEQVDHINHNGLDNRRVNIRICTPSQNHGNEKIRSGMTSKYKGVYQRKGGKGGWISRLYLNGKHLYLGSFKEEDDAGKAYDIKAFEIFGEFANPNFPKESYTLKEQQNEVD